MDAFGTARVGWDTLPVDNDLAGAISPVPEPKREGERAWADALYHLYFQFQRQSPAVAQVPHPIWIGCGADAHLVAVAQPQSLSVAPIDQQSQSV